MPNWKSQLILATFLKASSPLPPLLDKWPVVPLNLFFYSLPSLRGYQKGLIIFIMMLFA